MHIVFVCWDRSVCMWKRHNSLYFGSWATPNIRFKSTDRYIELQSSLRDWHTLDLKRNKNNYDCIHTHTHTYTQALPIINKIYYTSKPDDNSQRDYLSLLHIETRCAIFDELDDNAQANIATRTYKLTISHWVQRLGSKFWALRISRRSGSLAWSAVCLTLHAWICACRTRDAYVPVGHGMLGVVVPGEACFTCCRTTRLCVASRTARKAMCGSNLEIIRRIWWTCKDPCNESKYDV